MTPLRSAAFRWLWCSSLASSGAQGLERTTTAWLALLAGGAGGGSGALGVGLVFAARNVPALLFGLMSGTIADRADRPRLLMAVSGTTLLLMLVLSWWSGLGRIEIWLMVLISAAVGCQQVFDTPARQALVLDTVPREAATGALALNALATRLAMALGAFSAGALIPLIGVSRCYLVVAGVQLVAALLVARLRVRREQRAAVAHPPFRHALRDAARMIVDIPAVRILMIAGVACEVFAFSHGSALPVFSQEVLGAGPGGLGTLNAAAAIGGTLAVLLLSLLPGRIGRQPLLGTTFVLYGLSLVVLANTRNLYVAAAVLLFTGLCAATFDVLQQTLIQLAVPEEQRGRAVGVWVLGLGSAPVGNLQMGTMIALLGAPTALLINGSLTVLSAVLLLLRVPGYRWARRARAGAHS